MLQLKKDKKILTESEVEAMEKALTDKKKALVNHDIILK